jgi:hypothetical protein
MKAVSAQDKQRKDWVAINKGENSPRNWSSKKKGPAFTPVSRCVPLEQEKRVRIPFQDLERLYGGVCEK